MVYLEGNRCYLRTLDREDGIAMTEMVIRNKAYWSRHEPLHSAEYYTVSAQIKKIEESNRQMRINREYSFGIFLKGTTELIGHISVYAIKRLPFSSAFVGYSIDENYEGQGLTTEALHILMRFIFEDLSIHRIEAYVSPKNKGSVRVLEKAGFVQEGLLRQLLYINGAWEDHYMYAFLESQY